MTELEQLTAVSLAKGRLGEHSALHVMPEGPERGGRIGVSRKVLPDAGIEASLITANEGGTGPWIEYEVIPVNPDEACSA